MFYKNDQDSSVCGLGWWELLACDPDNIFLNEIVYNPCPVQAMLIPKYTSKQDNEVNRWIKLYALPYPRQRSDFNVTEDRWVAGGQTTTTAYSFIYRCEVPFVSWVYTVCL